MRGVERRRGRSATYSDDDQPGRSDGSIGFAGSEDDDDPPAPPVMWSPSRQGLHHRHIGTSSQNEDESPNARGSPEYGKYRKKKHPKKGKLESYLRTVAVYGIAAYLFFLLGTYSRQIRDGSIFFLTDKVRAARYRLDEKETKLRKETVTAKSERATTRLLKTRPPASRIVNSTPDHQVLLADQEERLVKQDIQQMESEFSNMHPASMDELCGFHAKRAYMDHPESYPRRFILNKDSRVLITGILNPVGFHLALALKERCGVEVMAGVDNMFPNTAKNRMNLQEQIHILNKNIPELVKPIIHAYVGLDPAKVSKKSLLNLERTDELDWMSFQPTHIVHVAAYGPEVYRTHNPDWRNFGSPYVKQDYDPNFYTIRSGLTGMDHLMQSIVNADPKERPQFTYASSNLIHRSPTSKEEIVHSQVRRMDEVIADAYYAIFGTPSVAIRLPNGIYGPWGHPASDVSKILNATAYGDSYNHTLLNSDQLDLVHVSDVVDAIISSMQYRSPTGRPSALDLTSGVRHSLRHVEEAAHHFLAKDNEEAEVPLQPFEGPKGVDHLPTPFKDWRPSLSIEDGIRRTLAWHLDEKHPYGVREVSHDKKSIGSVVETGDDFLQRHALSTCKEESIVCHASRHFMPCASECATREHCTPSIFDETIPMLREVTEGCDIVLYTEVLGNDIIELNLHAEYMDEGDPLICNFAFVSVESEMVQNVIHKVPDSELKKLGVVPEPEDGVKPDAFRKRKFEKLNGRLLYRGWILLWPKYTPDTVPDFERWMLKLAPGNLFSHDVKHAVYIDQTFAVSPTLDDIHFLVHEMYRPAWSARTVKRKKRPKAKFLIPPEPERRAVILMSELKFQESSQSERLPPDTKISIFEATKFMRFELGEDPLGKEPTNIRDHRQYYDQVRQFVNPDAMRSSDEPAYKFEMKHWVRSRWVVHDLRQEEGRQLRCEWYHEVTSWDTELDQLSFAYVMAKRELERKMAFNELDDEDQKSIAEKTEIKKLLSDAFEWHPLLVEQNRAYTQYEEIEVLPYDFKDIDQPHVEIETEPDPEKRIPLFARVISDRIMSYARKAWNDVKERQEHERHEREKHEKKKH